MTTQSTETSAGAARDQWVALVTQLVDQVQSWAQAQGWSFDRAEREIDESLLGRYTAPTLRVRAPAGEVHVNPVARYVAGGDGRIDLEAWPTLNRVRLVRRGEAWDVITDSNVRLRRPWNLETFLDLAHDLTAAA